MRLPALLVLVALGGCAHETTQQKQYKEALHAWVGQDVNRAFEMMGPPVDTFQMPNGRTQYTWVVAKAGTTRHTPYASTDVTKRCKTVFTATPDGIVDAIRSEGRCGVGK